MRRVALTLIVLACALPALRADDAKTPADEVKQVRADWSKAQQDWYKEYQAAKTPEDQQKAIQNQPKPDKYIDRLLEVAQKNTKEPATAVDALFLAVQLDRNGTGKGNKALELLTKEFADSDQIKPANLLTLAYSSGDEAAEFLKAVAAKNKDKDLQGVATYVMAQGIRQRVQTIQQLKEYPEYAKSYEQQIGKDAFDKLMKQEPADLDKEAEKTFAVVADKYKDVEIPWGREKVKLGTKAEANLFEMRKLKVGEVVPDEALETLDGKKIKLSDLRGKVVVLDIWATWCGPCRAMIPHEREMVKKLADKPFVLMSISADNTKDVLEKFLEKEEMPWKHVYNGPTSGIVEKWNVSYYPTIYVIDAKGVIRHKDIRDKKLEEAVEKLLKDAEESSKKSS